MKKSQKKNTGDICCSIVIKPSALSVGIPQLDTSFLKPSPDAATEKTPRQKSFDDMLPGLA